MAESLPVKHTGPPTYHMYVGGLRN